MVLKSYSKVNLTLKVNSKLLKGLHEIQSLYCLINLFDKIEINKTKKKKDKIIFKGPFSKLVKRRNNSVNILLKKLRESKLISNYYSVIIQKNIPVFSGFGGGTSNAAFIFKYLLKSKINNTIIAEFNNIIGSDFKLFFAKQGFLENLQTVIEFKKKQKFYFLLVKPRIKCSTRDIYSNVSKFSKKEKFSENLINSKNKYLEYLFKNRNDLQLIVERKYPSIKKLLTDIKNQKGCYFARMTGSGSVCYGLFKDQINAKKGLIKLKKKYPRFWFSLSKTV